METYDHQSSVDAAKSHEPSAAPTENMTANAPGTASVQPEPAAQAMPGQSPGGQAQDSPAGADRTAFVDPSTQTATSDQQGQTVSQSPQAQLNPNVIMDPTTGQLYYAMPPQGQPIQPLTQNGQYVYYTPQTPPQTPPEQVPEPRQPDYAQIIKSVEDFAEGDASVADVVKTLWTETAQDDQFWKGAVVGAAAAFLLTNDSVRGAMGKTFGSLFGKNAADAAASSATVPDIDPTTT